MFQRYVDARSVRLFGLCGDSGMFGRGGGYLLYLGGSEEWSGYLWE